MLFFTNMTTFNPRKTLWDRYHSYSHFTDEAKLQNYSLVTAQVWGGDFNPCSQLQSFCSCLIHATLKFILLVKTWPVSSHSRVKTKIFVTTSKALEYMGL